MLSVENFYRQCPQTEPFWTGLQPQIAYSQTPDIATLAFRLTTNQCRIIHVARVANVTGLGPQGVEKIVMVLNIQRCCLRGLACKT